MNDVTRSNGGMWPFALALTGGMLAALLGCSSSDHAAALPSGGGGNGDGGPGAGGARGIAGRASGGARARDAGHGAPDGNSGPTEDAGPDGAPPLPEAGCVVHPEIAAVPEPGNSVCAKGIDWAAGAAVARSASAGERLIGRLTPDELTLVWMSVENGAPALHYADRASVHESFGFGDPIFPGKGYYAAEVPGLSPDGLRIVVVRSDRRALGEYTRPERFRAFTDAPSEGAFDSINAIGIMLPEGATMGDPVISGDDRTMYYSMADGISHQTVLASVRPDDVPWMLGAPVLGAPLQASCGLRRRPTGISSDELTLFYWDELSLTERVTFRSSTTAPFVGAIDLGARAHAEPNASCSRLYHSASSSDAGDATDVVFSFIPGLDAGP